MNQPKEIDHNIDVRYAPDLETAFNRFIEKWCGENYPHLIDTDDNDGQFVRDFITQQRTNLISEIREKMPGKCSEDIKVISDMIKNYSSRSEKDEHIGANLYRNQGYNQALTEVNNILEGLDNG